MRISDWSSDVGSSDLADPRPCRDQEGQGLCPGRECGRQISRRPALRRHHRRAGQGAAGAAELSERLWRDLGEARRYRRADLRDHRGDALRHGRSEEHTSELQSLMRISYAVFCLKKKKNETTNNNNKLSKAKRE